METKHCPYCGETLPTASTFCPACFKELSEGQTTTTTNATTTPIMVSKERSMLFLWLGIGVLVVLFFIFMIIFCEGQESTEAPATATPFLPPEYSVTVDSTFFKHTPYNKVSSATPDISVTSVTSVTFTPNITTTVNTTTPTLLIPTKVITATILQTASATIVQQSTPTYTPKNTVVTVSKPTTTQTLTPTKRPTTDTSQFAYTVSNGAAIITEYNGNDSIVYVPDTIDGYTVKEIGSYAFSYTSSLKEVYLPDGITKINQYAFDSCIYLEKLYIPETVTSLGEGFCHSCYNLSTVNLPKSLTSIPDNAFVLCGNLKSISIPDTLQFIGSGAFANTGLEQISIPASVTQMESSFYNMSSLKYIEVNKENPVYYSENGVLFRKGQSNIYHTLLVYPVDKTNSNYALPRSTVYIATDAFRNNQFLQTVTLSEDLITIEPFAFDNCKSLTTVKTYGKLQTIYVGFQHCSNLTNLNLEPSVINLDENVFFGCDNLTLTVEKDSYAHRFAKENGISYKLK